MDKRFKLPILILVWTCVVVAIMFALIFVYGMYLGVTDPTYLME